MALLILCLLDGRVAEAQPAPYQMPATLPYQSGHTIPDGYHVEERPRRGLLIAGASVFGGFYLAALVSALSFGGRDHAFYWLDVPFVGPVVTIATFERCDSGDWLCMDSALIATLVFLYAGQFIGALLFASGLEAPPKSILVRDSPPSAARDGIDWAIVPRVFGADGLGLALVAGAGAAGSE